MQPTVYDLLPEERESLERILHGLSGMSPDERHHLLTNVFVTALYYRRERNADVLDRMAQDLLGTMRLHASPAYRKAVTNAPPPDLSKSPISMEGLLNALPEQR